MGLLAAIANAFKPAEPPDPATVEALKRISELVDPILKAAPGFQHKLAGPVHHSLGYCEGLVAGLPGPIDVGRQAFSADPLVHALFATAEDIGAMLGNSQAVQEYLETPASWQGDHFYALLAARRMEKRQLGMALQGDVVQSGVPQTVLYFSDHLVVEPHADLESARAHLGRAAFDSLLKSFHAHVEALRLERASLTADCSVERAHLTVLRNRIDGGEFTVHTRRLEELDAHLRRVAESLLPDQLEEALAAYLLAPEVALRLDPVTVSVDRLGVMAEPEADGSPDVATLTFPELCGRDRRRHLVLLARIGREEARQAVESIQERKNRFLVI